MDSDGVVGLIAGAGRLPFLVAAGARQSGLRVICVGLAGSAEPALAGEVDVFYPVAVARPGTWIRRLKKHGVVKTIMVGRVCKGRLYTPWRILRYLPDWRAFRTWYWRLRGRNKQADQLLGALAEELAAGGIILEDSTMYCADHMASEGVMTRKPPGQFVKQDIAFGWAIAKKLGELDIGQAVAVKQLDVIAVEAVEGTAAMIERAGRLCPAGGWTLVKVAKPGQDMRFDVPCVGPDTVRDLAANGCRCLVVEKGKTIIIDKPATIELADRLGVTILGR